MGGAFRPQWRELPAIVLRLSLQVLPETGAGSMPSTEITGTSRYLSHVPIWITSDLPTTQCSLLALLIWFRPLVHPRSPPAGTIAKIS